MNQRKNSATSPILWAVISVASCLSVQAQEVGKVARLLPAASISRNGTASDAKVPDPVAINDVLKTDQQGRMQVRLQDGSSLSLGSHSEMRVVKNDASSSQSLVELLYGRLRARIATITRSGGSFQVNTPVAVVGVLGTELAIVATETSSVASSVSSTTANTGSTAGRDFTTLAQLTPGAAPGKGATPTIADYRGVDEVTVYGIDRITVVKNILPTVPGTVFLFPGEFTIVRRGQPPTRPQRAESRQIFAGLLWPEERSCDALLDLSQAPPNVRYKITGLGTSTGEVFKVHVEGECSSTVFIPFGAVLKPTGFSERIIKSIILGEVPQLKDFQIMMSEGGSRELGSKSSSTNDFTLRGYCLELHKLAPHPKTEYKLVTADDQRRLAPSQEIIGNAYRLYFLGKMHSRLNSLTNIVQWSIWASRGKMDEKTFREEHMKLVKKNFEVQKKRMDSARRKQVEEGEADLWQNVTMVLSQGE